MLSCVLPFAIFLKAQSVSVHRDRVSETPLKHSIHHFGTYIALCLEPASHLVAEVKEGYKVLWLLPSYSSSPNEVHITSVLGLLFLSRGDRSISGLLVQVILGSNNQASFNMENIHISVLNSVGIDLVTQCGNFSCWLELTLFDLIRTFSFISNSLIMSK